MTEHFHVLLEWDPEAGVWVTYVPTLNGLSTFGKTREEALAETREAILGYLEAAKKEGIPLPHPTELVELQVAVG
jgi:predicted RNase H-like HicB family nuclease